MEKEGKNQRPCRGTEPDFLLQWGNRKRLRCIKVKDDEGGGGNSNGDLSEKSGGQKRTKTRVNRRVIKSDKESPSASPSLHHPTNPLIRRSESGASESRKSPSSPEKEDSRFYTTRGSAVVHEENGNGRVVGLCVAEGGGGGGEEKVGGGGGEGMILPRFFVSLSSKEKEEDFMAMKGCKLPQRPKKRAKFIQRTLLLVSPGAWLSDLSQERYEVREKKSSRKRKRGLKAMCMESDSE